MAFSFSAATSNPGFASSFANTGAGAALNNAATGFGGFGGVPTPFAPSAQPPLVSSTLGHPNTALTNSSTVPIMEPTVTIPPHDDLFPNRSTWYKITDLLNGLEATNCGRDEASLAAQELIYLLSQSQHVDSIAHRLLHHPNSILQTIQPDYALRQRLELNPTVNLSVEQDDGSFALEQASLTHKMLVEVCSIADDLRISEVAAISLYYQASSSKVPFRSNFVRSYLRSSAEAPKEIQTLSLPWMARELYMAQSSLLLRTCLILLQYRLREGNELRSDNPVTEATDALFQSGWISSLIQLAMNYTTHIDTVLVAIYASSPHATVASTGSDAFLWRYHISLEVCYKERLLAAECIFFATYNIQTTTDEVVALISSLQFMTNSSRVMNPYTDVPDPYEPISIDGAMPGAPWIAHTHQKQEKDPLEWQHQLSVAAWQTGQPQLLRCFCIILMANISALGDQAVLMDRTTHLHNSFGVGNALFPPGSDGSVLAPIHNVLNASVVETWNRPEVLGLLMASYAILLNSSPNSRSSPRASGIPAVDGSADIRKMFRECFKAPADLKSFSFARFAVLPALHVPALSTSDDYAISSMSISDPKEFYLSVLADFSSQYLATWSKAGERLPSRERWELNAEALLRLRHTHREQQQSFQGQFFPSDPVVLNVDAEVDLSTRPDCMDDIFAFASAVCSLGPEYSLKFWLPSSTDSNELVPSPALMELERHQCDDDSLRPTYLSFLAALSVAGSPSENEKSNGADVVYNLLLGGAEMKGWCGLLQDIRWYICQLDPRQLVSSREAPASSSTTGGSTSYYYNQSNGLVDSAASWGTGSDTSSEVTLLGLGERNEFFLLALLSLLTNVAQYSTTARSSIRALKVPFRNPETQEVVSQDTSFGILFALSSMPISPELRGAVFVAIAKLLPVGGADGPVEPDMREVVTDTWKLLDSYQIVPTLMLERYASAQDSFSLQNTTGISFPPSSTATGTGKLDSKFIPRDLRFSILYELEYIESSLGFYPSTEGFLQLLTSLFDAGGNHSLLGQDWPRCPGSAPFIEYVVDYVLPRTSGRFEGFPPLPFRSADDKNRLQMRALEVVHAVLIRYIVPLPGPSPVLTVEDHVDRAVKLTQQATNAAFNELELGKPIIVLPHVEDFQSMIDDFRPDSFNAVQPLAVSSYSQPLVAVTSRSTLPRAKSPGFYVLASILSDAGPSLLTSTITPILDYFTTTVGRSLDSFSMALALYIAKPPTFDSAKLGVGRRRYHDNILKPLRPGSSSHGAGDQTQEAILISLRILCATLAREVMFVDMANDSPERTFTVPVLNFSKKSVVPTVHNMHPMPLSQRLINPGVIASLVRLVGATSGDSGIDATIASAALGIFFMVIESLPRGQRIDTLRQLELNLGERSFARAFQARLVEASSRSLISAEANLFRFVFDRLLRELRDKGGPEEVTPLVLGIETSSLSAYDSVDVLKYIVNMLGNIDGDLESFGQCLAPTCYEVLYRVMAINKGHPHSSVAESASERLRAIDFWRTNIHRILSSLLSRNGGTPFPSDFYRMHSLSWLLKSAAMELNCLIAFSADATTVSHPVAPRSDQYRELLHCLFTDDGFLEKALRILPLEIPLSSSTFSIPLDQTAVVEAKEAMVGSPDVVSGYYTLNSTKLVHSYEEKGISTEHLMASIEYWNDNIQRDCASAHLSDAIGLIVAASFYTKHTGVFSGAEPDFFGGQTVFRILQRMCIDESRATSALLTDVLYPTACRNLASAIRMTSTSVESRNGNRSSSRSPDFDSVGSLIAQVMTSMRASNVSASNRGSELVSLLGCALLPVLTAQPFVALPERDYRFYFHAAVVLAELIGRGDDRHASSNETLMLRASLARLLNVLEATSSPDRLSPACDVLTTRTTAHSPIEAILSLISLLDTDIAFMLQFFVGLSPHVVDLLLASGIFEMLQKASSRYKEEESKFLSSQPRDLQDIESMIEAPAFLSGHCDLMSALLVSQSSKAQFDIAVSVVATLHSYKPTLERLFQRFPRDGNTLYSVLRCLTQATAVIHQRKTDGGSRDFLASSYVESLDLLRRVATFSKLVAENPFPQTMLGPIPAERSFGSTSGVVVLSQSAEAVSWWDSQKLNLAGFTSEVIELAQLGADMLLYSMAVVRYSKAVSLFDEYALSRMLIRCSDAANRVNEELRSPCSKAAAESEARRCELIKLSTKFYSVIQELLLLSVASLRQVPPPGASFSKRMSLALAHAPLEISNLGSHAVLTGDENQLTFVSHLVQLLKGELELQLGGK